MYPSAGAIPMHLASDYIHLYRSAGGRPARCRVRIYLPDDAPDAQVVIRSELPTSLVWIEYWPKDTTSGGEETFELVVFSSYEIEALISHKYDALSRIRGATWKGLDRATVGALVEGKVKGLIDKEAIPQ